MPKTTGKSRVTALYERLSRDDDLVGESNSITNQDVICKGDILPKYYIIADGSFAEIASYEERRRKMAKGGTMVIGYTAVGDYLLPNIAYCDETLRFGRYSRLRQKFLKENHGGVYNDMLFSGSLWEHLAEAEISCQARLEQIVLALAESEDVTEALKETNQLEWACKMNSILKRAEEIVLSELIYAL